MKQLLGNLYERSNPEWVIQSYFDWIYDSGYFIEMVSNVVKKRSFTTDDVACRFPDMDSYFEEDHFEGVELIVALRDPEPDEVKVPDGVFWRHLQLACREYLERHPGDRLAISNALEELSAG